MEPAERLYFPKQLKGAGNYGSNNLVQFYSGSFVRSVLEYACQSATVCLASTTATFRLPFAENVIISKKDIVKPVLPRNVIIGHFRVPKTLNFKTRLSANLSLNEFYLHEKNGFALRLALKQRLEATWK